MRLLLHRGLTVAFAGALALALVPPDRLLAQLASSDDPCFSVLTGWSSLGVLQDVDISDIDRLTRALRTGDVWTAERLIYLTARQQEIDKGAPLTAAERSQWQQIRDCLPWLSDALARIGKALTVAGVTTVDATGDRSAPGVALPPDDLATRLKGRIRALQRGIRAAIARP